MNVLAFLKETVVHERSLVLLRCCGVVAARILFHVDALAFDSCASFVHMLAVGTS